MGCNFLLGRVGFISFGQPAYLAVGAYATAFYLFYFGTNPYVGILIGLAAGMAFAFIVGLLFVRLRSDYFALVNLALAVIIFYMLQKVLRRHHPGRQRAVVPDQYRRHAGLRPDTAEGVLPLLPRGRRLDLGHVQVPRRHPVRRLLPGHQDQRRQARVPRLQQLQDPPDGIRHRQHHDGARRQPVCRLSRLRQPRDEQPRTRRRPGGGHDPRRRRDAVRADRRHDRLYRHEGRGQQVHRQLGAVRRLHPGLHHADRTIGI